MSTEHIKSEVLVHCPQKYIMLAVLNIVTKHQIGQVREDPITRNLNQIKNTDKVKKKEKTK